MSNWMVFLLVNNIGCWVVICIGIWRRIEDNGKLDGFLLILARLEEEIKTVRRQLDH